MIRKSVLVIAGSSDIGKAIIRNFIDDNYDIITTFHTHNIDELKLECERKNLNFTAFNVDVKDYNQIQELFKNLKDVEYLESVIFCAGISLGERMLIDESYENINALIDTNLKGAIYCGKEAIKYFENKKHGSIVYISSIYGQYGGACEAVYSASKGGINGLVKALATECAGMNIRVNAVAPGFIQTNMTNYFTPSEKEQIREAIPLKRLGNVQDVANAVQFLSSDKSSYITGEIINVSGGAIKF